MKRIKYLVMDVDGTLTDGKIYIGNQGELFKAFSVKDGSGILDMVHPTGITPVIITGRKSDIVRKRCEELKIREVHQGISNKLNTLCAVAGDLSKVAYIGDDRNDLVCMEAVKAAGGITACPRDAVREILEISDYITDHKGGDGAVRDFIEWLLASKEV